MKYFIFFLAIVIVTIGGIYLAIYLLKEEPLNIFDKESLTPKKSDFDRYIQQEDSRAIYELLEGEDKG